MSHDHHGAITHVHGGPTVLDIGGSVGALHVVLDEEWLGRELFVATDDPAFTAHTGVWPRHRGGGHVASALFAQLEEGTYRIVGADGEVTATVEVTGGDVTDVDLSAAARVAPAR